MSTSLLDAALAQAYADYTERNPRSLARHQAAAEVMPGGNTRTVLYYSPFPLGVARAEGCYLLDLDGHRYVDFLGEYTAGIYGHSHPVIRAALEQALDDGINFGGPNVMEVRLAQAVCQRFPAIASVRFTNSGTEANLMALTAARAFTQREKIMVFAGGYHGGVLYFSGGTNSPVNAPYDFVIAPYNDLASTAALIEQHGTALAAIILEPMLGGGGCIPADRAFLALLREATTRFEALLIFDEVMTSRLAPGGLQAVHGILPDLTTLGKYIGGGMSFGAFGGRADIMAQFDPGRPAALPHAGTFNNNVLTMSAGLAGLTEIYTPAAAVALNERGDALRNRLNDLCRRHEAPMQFTGLGSMLNVHMTDAPIHSPNDAAQGDQALRELFFFDLLNDGIWLARRGMITLSLPIGDAECERLVHAVERFIQARATLLAQVA
ncbi:MAG: aspartate aminotransferase family protein [Caldilineaceae bacterium]|nr:aspartate aminotransferase family protein [Caldilineaceae bacterium]